MESKFARPFKHPRHVLGTRPQMCANRVTETRVTDYVTSRMKDRNLDVPLSERVLASPTVASLACGTVVAPFAVPALITAVVYKLTELDYHQP